MQSPVHIFSRFVIFAAIAALQGCGDAAPASPLEQLAELHDLRSIGPRISIETRHRPCSGADAARDTVAPITCPSALPPPDVDLLALASTVSARVSSRADAEALHAAGLIDLLWRGGSGNSIDRAISYLTAAADLSDSPAAALTDLAAAYLIRAEHAGSPRDLLRAVDAAARAEAREPGHRGALYNLALALDRLAVDIEAGHAWRQYQGSDPHSGWGEEARAREAALRRQEARPAPPQMGAEDEAIRAFALQAPQEARLHGWDVVLGEWANAVLQQDRDAADANLRVARLLGHALASAGGDATLADAVQVIDAADSRPRTRQLARAHRAYSIGRERFLAVEIDVAADSFAAALGVPHGSPVLQGWLEVYHAGTIMLSGRLDEGWNAFNRVLEGTDSARYPALAGQAAAAMSTARLRAGRFEDAIEHASTSAAWFARAREREARGSQLVLQSGAELAIGVTERGYRSSRAALLTLRPYRRSVWRYNALLTLAPPAAGEGLHHASVRLMNEAVAVADLMASRAHLVEGLLNRTRILMAAADSAAAREDLLRARALLAQMEPGSARDWMRTDLRLSEAAMAASRNPARAIAALDSILTGPAGTGTEVRLLAALVARAEARLGLADPEAAAADLEAAAELIGQEAGEISRSSLRAALLDGARSIFDRLVLFELARGDPARALEHLERSRMSFVHPAASGGAADTRIPFMPPRETALSYMLAGDTVLAWLVDSTGLEVTRTVVPGGELTRTIARVRASLELGAGSETLGEDLATLHEVLVAPMFGQRPPAERLVIVADGEIADVPFPALLDRSSNRYLVQDHELRFASSLRDVGARTRTRSGAGTRSDRPRRGAIFVGDPDGTDGSAGFAPLPGSAKEVRTLATYYPDADLITGASMDARTVTSALRRSEIFHFAGHAVFDEARPELSFLVLGEGAGGDPDRLRAGDLHGMDLRHVRLVVLAACETLRAGGGRSGGFAGFAGILLQTGVGGLVGSLWRVDDVSTTHLMLAFHEAYASSGNGPASLRSAQLRLLASTDPALSSPAAWAAFRYAGD